MERINIDTIKKFVTCGKIRWTNHVIIRLLQRNINQRDVEHALLNGTIIEEYENDYPYPSCLYYPNRDEWNEDMKTRKESK